jgi:hypothetical protein
MDCDNAATSPPRARTQAITFDAFGTLLYLNRSFHRIAQVLKKSLLGLRQRCAEILFSKLAQLEHDIRLPGEVKLKVLTNSIRCNALLDTSPYLTISRARYGTTLRKRKTILNNPRNE